MLTVQLNELVQTMNKLADAYIRKYYPLTFSRFLLLETLHCVGATTQHGIAAEMGVSDPVVSRMMSDLDSAGYLRITRDPSHGRKNRIEATEKGMLAARKIGTVLEEAFAKVVNEHVDDVERFSRNITKVLAAIQEYGEIK